MDLHQLRCFVATAEELHFGKAAQRLDMLPTALGRHIRLLEDDLGMRLLARTTRSVSLTQEGEMLLDEARVLIAKADSVAARFREQGRSQMQTLRVGAIDSAAAGLIPLLLHDFRKTHPEIGIHLCEEKTIKLLPKLLSGRIDIAFIRPRQNMDARLAYRHLFHETAIVAVPKRHRLARRDSVHITHLANEPLIVPERRSRPHSHDLTIKLFAEAGLHANVAQVADEKQTIVNLVAAGMGVAIVPHWTSRMAAKGVKYLPLKTAGGGEMNKLPLAVAWVGQARDPLRDALLEILSERLNEYARDA
ncbi:MAG: LysR family transcriptional regulator [Xanthobacteraceae bacterium]|nr:LysR family transcriptional regulator [Xanthobacteraceae bacterium]